MKCLNIRFTGFLCQPRYVYVQIQREGKTIFFGDKKLLRIYMGFKWLVEYYKKVTVEGVQLPFYYWVELA